MLGLSPSCLPRLFDVPHANTAALRRRLAVSARRGLAVLALHVGTAVALMFAGGAAEGSAMAMIQQGPTAARTDSLFRAGLADLSYREALAHAARSPNDYGALWRASRAETFLGIITDKHAPEKSEMFRRAEGYARRAIAREPKRPEGHYWLAAALGRHTRVVGMFAAVRFGRDAHQSTLRVLAIDSLFPGAHGLLGKINSDVQDLPAIARFFASGIVGSALVRQASWQTAERSLIRAIALDPEMVIFRYDLLELYLRTQREADADRTVRALVALPIRTPADTFWQRDAAGKLENYRKARRKTP